MGVDVERMLQSIHTNFVWLTHRVPMAQVEDLPEAIQSQVVGVPRAWVWLFRWIARAVVTFHNQNPLLFPSVYDEGSLQAAMVLHLHTHDGISLCVVTQKHVF